MPSANPCSPEGKKTLLQIDKYSRGAPKNMCTPTLLLERRFVSANVASITITITKPSLSFSSYSSLSAPLHLLPRPLPV